MTWSLARMDVASLPAYIDDIQDMLAEKVMSNGRTLNASSACKTMAATCFLMDAGRPPPVFVPCMINGENHAVPVDPAREDGEAVVKYMHENSRAAG